MVKPNRVHFSDMSYKTYFKNENKIINKKEPYSKKITGLSQQLANLIADFNFNTTLESDNAFYLIYLIKLLFKNSKPHYLTHKNIELKLITLKNMYQKYSFQFDIPTIKYYIMTPEGFNFINKYNKLVFKKFN